MNPTHTGNIEATNHDNMEQPFNSREREVLSALETLVRPNILVEMRVLGTRTGTISGYYDQLPKMALDAVQLDGLASGIYMTLNPVDTRLKARSHNNFVKYAKHTAADSDIIRRVWLPIDFDPLRPAGISATEEEHRVAIDRAKEVQGWLLSIGFPDVILADSGNGAHLLGKIDLPNDEASRVLLASVLTALDFMFGDDKIGVDKTTYNAARIWKMYGTLARKGENLPERPHRRAKILYKPALLEVVGGDLLQKVAGMGPQNEQILRRDFSVAPTNTFSVDDWIRANDLPVARSAPWQNGHKWVLRTCPWNAQHADSAAYIIQHASGAIAAGCHHNACADKGWKELRALYSGPKEHHDFDTNAPTGERGNISGPALPLHPPALATAYRAEWPKPAGQAAFAGLAGRVVTVADPHTEADPVAVLGSFLTAFGCAIGKGPFALVGASEHYPRIFTALVGRTSKGRKGESWSPNRKAFSLAAPDWASHRILTGLSTGEGLISAVRDSRSKPVAVKGSPGEYEMQVVDEGVGDKRLLVIEPEFARVLRVMTRQGNTLNAIMRDAWDRGNLNVMTKDALQATGAHISIVGHITLDELRQELTDTDAANGFANRFIWLSVSRSKELPNPTPFDGPDVARLAVELKDTLEYASQVGLMKRTLEANELWREVYHDLSAERDGLVGSILGRAEAQVLRLSLLYALLDRANMVTPSHLLSALELWDYSVRSAKYVFGDATGDPIADRILEALKLSGTLTRTEVSAVFSKNVSSARLSQALFLLHERGMVRVSQDDTGGRPVEVWSIVT